MDGSMMRQPPQSIEAEQAVLGGLMLRNDSWTLVAGELEEGDFYRRDHQLIFRAIKELATLDPPSPLDFITIGQWFLDRGDNDHASYLIDLSSNTPSAANIKAYAKIVADKATLRRLITVGTDAVNMGFDPDGRDTDELIAQATTQLSTVMKAKGKSAVTGKEALRKAYDSMIARYESTDDLAGLPTGNADLDELTSGLQPGRVYGIGGRPKMGKSTLAKEILRYNAMHGTPVAIWTMEMSEEEVILNMVAALARVDSRKLQRPKMLQDEDWARVTEAMRTIKDLPITIFPESGVSVERIEAEASVLVAQGKCKLVAIDYLSLMALPKADRHDISIGHITKNLKKMARNLGVPVILVFQLNRGNEQGAAVRPPRASDAKDSGNIEQDLDCMMLVHRPSYYDKSAPNGTQIDIPIQRNGPSGTVYVMEELEYGLFSPGGNQLAFNQGSSGKKDGKKAAANDNDFPT
jgi:replicative DNA helicase